MREDYEENRVLSWLGLLMLAMLLLACAWSYAYPHDSGQWENVDPATREWFQTLMMPDAPKTSCCGEADAYWCDAITVRYGHTFCRITDDRVDGPLKRSHIDVGTEIEIPDHKLKWDRGNPTGHSIVFMSAQRFVYCFVQGTGI